MAKQTLVVMVVLLVVAFGALPALAQDGDSPWNPEIDPANFVEGVDNVFFPLEPGTLTIYEGEDDGEPEYIEVYVMHETYEVMGIPCVVVRDTVWEDGELVEDTFDWYAQDVEGNVWYMGEDSTEYEDGEAVSQAGSWEAGVDGALPGIIMYADPQAGDAYYQEYYAGEAEDEAEVVDVAALAELEYGDFENLLVIKEWTELDPGVVELKYYAEGIGVVLEEKVEGGEGRVELLSIETGLDDENRVDVLETEFEDEDE